MSGEAPTCRPELLWGYPRHARRVGAPKTAITRDQPCPLRAGGASCRGLRAKSAIPAEIGAMSGSWRARRRARQGPFVAGASQAPTWWSATSCPHELANVSSQAFTWWSATSCPLYEGTQSIADGARLVELANSMPRRVEGSQGCDRLPATRVRSIGRPLRSKAGASIVAKAARVVAFAGSFGPDGTWIGPGARQPCVICARLASARRLAVARPIDCSCLPGGAEDRFSRTTASCALATRTGGWRSSFWPRRWARASSAVRA